MESGPNPRVMDVKVRSVSILAKLHVRGTAAVNALIVNSGSETRCKMLLVSLDLFQRFVVDPRMSCGLKAHCQILPEHGQAISPETRLDHPEGSPSDSIR